MSFQLKTSYFEGPLDLLLSLIEDKKLHVSEISLAAVTEEYLHYLNRIMDSDQVVLDRIHDQSQFIVVAATLILIKARSLLPTMDLSQEETESIDDLTERLRIYAVVVRYAEYLKDIIGIHPVMFQGNPPREKKLPVFTPHESLTLDVLVDTLQDVLQAFPVSPELDKKTLKKTLSLTDVMQRVEATIASGSSFTMADITDRYAKATDPTERREAKVFAVLSFLVILEMIKKSQVIVEQTELFSTIVAAPFTDSSE
jgi:segregation and condensation protein A